MWTVSAGKSTIDRPIRQCSTVQNNVIAKQYNAVLYDAVKWKQFNIVEYSELDLMDCIDVQ